MRRWLKLVALAAGLSACMGVISRLWQDTWADAAWFGVTMCCVTLGVWGARAYVDRNARGKD
ncbi:hypothetical protein ACIBSR_13110 [Streptomyces sp. NPDC049936]|uniref:hypothetical protein n=1 Tax=Streptomyces sp. NPDC049936 TaxID=3365599 RepID=UPI0037B42CAC